MFSYYFNGDIVKSWIESNLMIKLDGVALGKAMKYFKSLNENYVDVMYTTINDERYPLFNESNLNAIESLLRHK